MIVGDPDGSDKKITMRKYEVPPDATNRAGVIIFIQVRAWWR
jgi:hypothetical protein